MEERASELSDDPHALTGRHGPSGHQPILDSVNVGSLQTQFTQTSVIIGPASERPAVLSIRFLNRQVIDTGEASTHQAAFVKFPVFVSVGTEPVSRVIVPLVCEPDRNAVVSECPQFLNQPIVEFPRPFALEKRDDFVSSIYEFRTIPPSAMYKARPGISMICRRAAMSYLLVLFPARRPAAKSSESSSTRHRRCRV